MTPKGKHSKLFEFPSGKYKNKNREYTNFQAKHKLMER